jgi:hypothetical protein
MTASDWDVGGFLFWMLIVIGALGLLAVAVVLAVRGDPPSGAPGSAPDQDRLHAALPGESHAPASGWDLVVLTFEHLTGAERALAEVRRAVGGDPAWLRDVAVVEVHRRGRARVRGTFAGRIVDVEDVAAIPVDGAILETIRGGVPEGSSGLVSLAPTEHVDALVAGFDGRATRVHRHVPSAREIAALRPGRLNPSG